MTNREIFKAVEQAGAWLEKMFYIPMFYQSEAFYEFINELEADDVAKLFPAISGEIWDAYRETEMLDALLAESGFEGWIVEIAIPERDNFRSKKPDGSYGSYRVNPAITRREYVYVDSFGDLVSIIEVISKKCLQEDIALFEKKESKNVKS